MPPEVKLPTAEEELAHAANGGYRRYMTKHLWTARQARIDYMEIDKIPCYDSWEPYRNLAHTEQLILYLVRNRMRSLITKGHWSMNLRFARSRRQKEEALCHTKKKRDDTTSSPSIATAFARSFQSMVPYIISRSNY